MKIAITGTIGSGKSEVCRYLRSKGFDVFSCDEYNFKLLEKGNIGYIKIKEKFPECFIDDELDKKHLSLIVFNDVSKRKELEGILHPLILDKMLLEAKSKDIFFAEVPLLFETGQEKYFDSSWLVATDENIALDRLFKRGLTEKEAKSRINNQMSVLDKKNKSNEIIYNNKDLKDLYIEIDKLLNKYVG